MIYTFTMLDANDVRHIAIKSFAMEANPVSACGAKLVTTPHDLLVSPVTCIACLGIQAKRRR